jgi:hypothetical protein
MGVLVKAVFVAVMGKDALWPGRHGDVGLLWMFASICASLMGLLVELLSATALVTGGDSTLQPDKGFPAQHVPIGFRAAEPWRRASSDAPTRTSSSY